MSDVKVFPADPVPSTPGSSSLTESYTYHSPTPTAPGPYILGVDEAGRGPVLGPLVYGIAYCPASWQEDLQQLGFAGKKSQLISFSGFYESIGQRRFQDSYP
jgi:ribonuclease H2 subunit A